MGELPAAAVGAKSARACDSCLVRRARWYCAADDAFLCQLCDSSVHSANPLARRHERVRLKTSTSHSKQSNEEGGGSGEEPAWHQGFRRKARTPRGGGGAKVAKTEVDDVGGSIDTIVPNLDLGSLEDFAGVEEEQLLYRVPVLEPVLLSDLCSSPTRSSDVAKPYLPLQTARANMAYVLPPVAESDVEISDFEMADVESFLRRGLGGGDEACSMEELGLMVEEDYKVKSRIPVVKKEEEVDIGFHREEAPMVKLDWRSPKEEIKPVVDGERTKKKKKRRRMDPIMLDLNYEGVMSSWNKQEASPWVDGARPQLDLDDWSPEFMSGGVDVEGAAARGGEVSGYAVRTGGGGGGDDGGREARVLRYREKRRTRLFSKKIRYEVRKLNAEKRPRMKGRFVKRASLLSNTTAATTISGGHGIVPQPQYVF